MQTSQRSSISPYITPRLTPTATPKVYSTNGSPRRYSSVESPQTTSGATSPTKSQYDGRASLSSWYPSSQQSSAASSPPRGRSTTGVCDLYLLHVSSNVNNELKVPPVLHCSVVLYSSLTYMPSMALSVTKVVNIWNCNAATCIDLTLWEVENTLWSILFWLL